jgi:hypothetical protein
MTSLEEVVADLLVLSEDEQDRGGAGIAGLPRTDRKNW